jgi:signal transduction histidine kinase
MLTRPSDGLKRVIQLVSTDIVLHRLCREVLAELPCQNLSVIVAEKYMPGSRPDICIWDCSVAVPALDLLERSNTQKYLFLVERNQVDAILDALPCAPVGFVLKPITRATLRTFLEQAVALCAASDGRGSAETGASDAGPRSDRDDILQYLLQANLRLQEYDQDRTNFLARATHDFRAPLTALNGYCGLMLEGMLGTVSPEQKEVLQRMQHSAGRLARMASSLYDLSVARRLQMSLEARPHPIDDCIEQAIHELAFFIEEKRIAITVQLTPLRDMELCLDPTRIEQLMVNLLDNACKFTPKLGAIEVFGYPYFWERRGRPNPVFGIERRVLKCAEPNSYRLDIRDSGPSIPAAVVSRIFEEYTSYSGPEDRSGAGLGLAICKTIARAHQGDIWAAGSEIGGAMFSVVLPFRSSGVRQFHESANGEYASTGL